MTAMRLFHIRSSYSYGGPERQITYLTRAMVKHGITTEVATFAPIHNPDRNRYFTALRELGITAHRIDIRGSFDRSAIKKLEGLLAGRNFSMLIGHDYRAVAGGLGETHGCAEYLYSAASLMK